MATTTETLGLTKPDQTDFYDVDVFNENFEIIDKKIKDMTENPTGAGQTTVTIRRWDD